MAGEGLADAMALAGDAVALAGDAVALAGEGMVFLGDEFITLGSRSNNKKESEEGPRAAGL